MSLFVITGRKQATNINLRPLKQCLKYSAAEDTVSSCTVSSCTCVCSPVWPKSSQLLVSLYIFTCAH
ncbi:hypothetical protein INR49_013547 [Caranx melampygus]|nr:hypothetical protein INR49_013547 [Caranx melampygus]